MISAADDSPENNAAPPHDGFSAFRFSSYRRYWSGNFLAVLGAQMLFVAVGWDIYDRTGETLQLGMVGLVQIIPVVLLALPAGHIVDRFDRRRVILVSLVVMIACALALALISWRHADYRWIYVCLFINGIARAFLQPAKAALLPSVVPRTAFANAVTWHTAAFQLATVTGPAIGGFSIALARDASAAYLACAALTAVFVATIGMVQVQPQRVETESVSLHGLFGGMAFVWRSRLILGAISLDMFAVLLGGATALLPVYAEDILHIGPSGLGWLRAAPGLGALVTSFVLARRPPMRKAGLSLLAAVAGFGICTIVFGVSRSFGLSMVMLCLTGAFDTVSVVVRHTIVQLWTPDAMRGRVSAINGMFIGISNEMGEFESGTVAHLFASPRDPAWGPTVSVVLGGIGTLAVVAMTAWVFPEVRRHGRLDEAPASP